MISPLPSWPKPPKVYSLSNKEVHVWCASLDQSRSQVKTLREILSDDELKRAERFYFPKGHRQFIVARGILRTLLSSYIYIDPGQIHFSYNNFDKPMLNEEFGGSNISFNLSHTCDFALYAFTLYKEVGVDIEKIKPNIDVKKISEQFFSPDEFAALHRLPSNIQQKAFYNCWTRKEAFIKAKGEGLSYPLDQFSVSLIPGRPVKLLSTKLCSDEASRWSLYDIDLGDNYCAALAVKGHKLKIKYWCWSI